MALRLSRLPVNEPVDKAGLAVLHEARRLGIFRLSDLAGQMRLDLSTISRHLRSLEQQGMVQRTADRPCPANQHHGPRGRRPQPSAGPPAPQRSAPRSPIGQRSTGAPCSIFSADWPTI